MGKKTTNGIKADHLQVFFLLHQLWDVQSPIRGAHTGEDRCVVLKQLPPGLFVAGGVGSQRDSSLGEP